MFLPLLPHLFGRQQLQEVLHHAFQARGAFEGAPARVGVLGIDELGHLSARFFEHRDVLGQAEDQLVRVAGVGGESIRAIHVSITSCSLQKGLQPRLAWRQNA